MKTCTKKNTKYLKKTRSKRKTSKRFIKTSKKGGGVSSSSYKPLYMDLISASKSGNLKIVNELINNNPNVVSFLNKRG